MAEETNEILQIQAEVDRASFTRAERLIRTLSSGFAGPLSDANAARIRRIFSAGTQAIDETTAAIERQNRALQQGATAATSRPDNRRAQIAAGADRAGTIGSQIFSSLGQSELANAAGFVGDFGSAVEQAGAKAALGVAGMVALSAALAFFESQNNRAAQTVRTLIATQGDYYRVVTSGTREQLQAARDAQQLEVDILRARVQENQNILGQLEAEIGSGGRALADVFNLAGARELREETQRLEQQLAAAEFQVGRYSFALESNATAAQDATAALEQAQQRFLDSLIQGAEAIEQDALQRARIEGLSSEAARQRIAAIEDERAALQESIVFLEQWVAAQPEAAAALEERRQQLINLNVEEAQLNQALSTTIAQREAEASAIERANARKQVMLRNMEREQQESKQTAQAVSQAQNQITALQVKAADETARIQEEGARRISEIIASAAEQRTNLLENAAIEERQTLQRAASERKRILRDGERAEAEAVGNRDALALLQSRRAKEDQLSDLEQNLKDESDARQESLRVQLQQAERATAAQVNAARQQVAAQVEAAQARVNGEIAAQRNIIATAQNAMRNRVALEQSAYGALGNAASAFAQRMIAAANALNSAKGGRPGASTAAASSGGSGGGGNVQMKALAQALGR